MIESHEAYPDTHHDVYDKTMLGFWLYLLTDFVLFGVMFATFAVLHKSYFGGPKAIDLFNVKYTFFQTLFLLGAATFSGFASNYLHRKQKKATLFFFLITFLLGLVFILMQFHEFSWIFKKGYDWQTSGYLSAYFTLVGIFSIHILFALTWNLILLIPVLKSGIEDVSIKRLMCLKMFWQFLNLIWIFIFSLVYLLGVI